MRPSTQTQLLLGEGHRNAGHDYHEHRYMTIDPKSMLEIASTDELDRQALGSEQFFRRRFRFDAPREQRQQVIEIKQVFDFTDREIRALRSTGALQVGKGKAPILKADRFLFYWGLFLMFPALCYWGLFAFAFYHPARGLPPFVAVAMTCAIACLLTGFTHYSTFRPINILRRRGFKLGDKFILHGTAE